MNNIHKVIFNKNTQQFVVVSELAKSTGKTKTVSADSLDIVSLLQNFSEKRPLVDFPLSTSGQILVKNCKSAYVGSSEDELNAKERHEYKQSGLTVAFSSAVTDSAIAANKALKRSNKVQDERLGTLLKVKAANEAVEAVEKAQQVIDGVQKAQEMNEAVSDGDFKVSVSVGASRSTSTSITQQKTHLGSELDAHKVIVRATEGDTTVRGSKINAHHTELEGKNVNLLATQDSRSNRSDNQNSSWSAGAFIGKSEGSSGIGVEGAATVGKGHSNSDSLVHNNTEINSKTLKINAKETTTLKGAVANIDRLQLDTKNLHIESLQDVEKYDSKQTQGGVSGSAAIYGSGWGVSARTNQNKANVDYAQVARQSGFNIKESSAINVAENTHLKGGIIKAEGDKADHRMRTGTLTTEAIENRSEIKVSSMSAGLSTSNMAGYAMNAALSALGNISESERSQTKAAISEHIDLTITDSEKQKALTGKTAEETLASLNRDTTNANGRVEKQDVTKAEERLETAQVIGELSQSWTHRAVNSHLEEANQKRAEADKLAKNDPTNAERLRNEAKAIEAEYGIGSNLQMGIRAATAALQGLATGSVEGAAVGALSPYANRLIKEQTTNADGSTNKEANLIAHAMLGAIEAYATGNNAAAGAAGALTAEAAAPYLMQALYNTDKVENLSDSQKQNLANLSQITAGLAGGITGDSTASFISGAEIGKRAVEDNYLSRTEAERKRILDDKAKAGTITIEEEAERHALAKKDNDTDLALIAACEGNPLSAQCHTERQKLEQAKFSYSGAEYTPTGYNYPTYTRYSDLYPEDYGKVASFSENYDVLRNAKVTANADFYEATGIDPSWFDRADVANMVIASIAGTKLSATDPSKTTQSVPKSANANERLPVVGKTNGYENQTADLKVSTRAENIALYPKLKLDLATEQNANHVISSLKTTGQLPVEYVTKEIAKNKYGWEPSKPFKQGQIGGDVFLNRQKLLPEAEGRIWREADIGINSNIGRSKQGGTRLLYSNDGLLFITTDHYSSFKEIGRWK